MNAIRTISSAIAISAFVASLGLASHVSATPTKRGQGVININTATVDQLGLLPGIGPSKASRVVSYRKKRQFRHAYEIIRVRGIGRRTYRKLKPYLRVSGPTTLTQRPQTKKDN